MTSHTRVVQETNITSDGNEIDLTDEEIAKAVDAVRSGGHQWVVLGYQGNTGRLKVDMACAVRGTRLVAHRDSWHAGRGDGRRLRGSRRGDK